MKKGRSIFPKPTLKRLSVNPRTKVPSGSMQTSNNRWHQNPSGEAVMSTRNISISSRHQPQSPVAGYRASRNNSAAQNTNSIQIESRPKRHIRMKWPREQKTVYYMIPTMAPLLIARSKLDSSEMPPSYSSKLISTGHWIRWTRILSTWSVRWRTTILKDRNRYRWNKRRL